MKSRNSANHQTSMHDSFNKAVDGGIMPRDYHIGGKSVVGKKGMLKTEGVFPVICKSKSSLRHGITPAKKGGAGRGPEVY